jgi:SAM-dependent methyltransferase
MVAFGGALGGLFVAVVAPETFPALWEFPILLVLTPAVILIRLLLEHRDPRVIPAPAALTGSRAFSWLGGGARFWSLWTLSSLAVVGLAGYLAQGQWQDRSAARLLTRNFYGALSVADYEDPDLRELAHGTIIHGEQYLAADKRRIPLTYYAPGTGVGLLMQDMVRQGRLRLGVIGLGAGTMAAWGRPGDTVRFYEINRAMVDIARTQFSYLGDCGCRPEVIMGDARLSLEREAGEQYDVLVVDAFSGDSIPVHLLTREAFEVYFRHLRPDGILAVHVTNSYLDLSHPVAAVAHDLGREAHLIVNEEDEASATFSSDWMLIGTQLSRRFAWIGAKETPVAPLPGRGVWTDDYSNLWEAMHQ